MTSRALFRLPFADSYTVVEQRHGAPDELQSVAQLDGRSGFVVAPFSVSAACPVLVIRPDHVERRAVVAESEVGGLLPIDPSDGATERQAYAAAFERSLQRLATGEFRKVVLARMSTRRMARRIDAEQLFRRACRLFPRLFVALVSTERGGTWLTATPETILSGSDGAWRTVALAGTMRLQGDGLGFDSPPTPGFAAGEGFSWSDKNIREQQFVATYIAEKLNQRATDVVESGPLTVRAGDVVHLRSDFAFRMKDQSDVGLLLDELHPTPAVCGLPKEPTQRFIVANEPQPRRYYSGFMGPLNLDGRTDLYVSLRCMELFDDHCCLYAGGGLLAESIEEQEWAETEAKMDAMRRVMGEGENCN